MVKVDISYNPYTVETNMSIDGRPLGQKSPLRYVAGKRLQEWIEPMGTTWQGIFAEMRKSLGESMIEINFRGIYDDYKDLEYAKEKYGNVFTNVTLNLVNKNNAMQSNPEYKFSEIKKLYKELQNGPIAEMKSRDIRDNFENALNSEFRITVVAPMSSGKSTLINAILERDLLPALNRATTAVITEIKCNDNLSDFVISARDKRGNIIADREPATQKLIKELNDKKDPGDKEGKEALIKLMKMEGKIPHISSPVLNLIFVDTPGGNNSQNLEHEQMMRRAIEDEDNSLILYIFDGTTGSTSNDSNNILRMIAEAMQRNTNGKQTRDRFLFVANKMDSYDTNDEPYDEYVESTIKPMLKKYGIVDPRLFLVSASTAKLIRMKKTGERLSEDEEDDLYSLIRKFSRTSRILPQYSTFNSDKLIKESLEMIENARNANNRADEEELRMRAAEINSGVPTLEAAINEYLNKYAVCIKIGAVHDTFMKKVSERQMIDNCKREWAQSQESLDKVINELSEKKASYEKNKKMDELKGKIKSIKLETTQIYDTGSKINLKLQDLQDNIRNNNKVKRSEVKPILESLRQSSEKICRDGIKDLEDTVNINIKDSCISIIQEYQDYIKELDEGGIFNIGNFSIKNTEKFNNIDMKGLKDVDEKYISIQSEKVGEKYVDKKGIRSWFARLFGVGGIEKVDIKENVEYVNVVDLFNASVGNIMTEVETITDDYIAKANEKIDSMKKYTNEKLIDLDNIIRDIMNEIENMTKNKDRLSAEVKANEKKTEWINSFCNKVSKLLEI